MKISLNWLKDFVDLKGLTAAEIADMLIKKTCEVEGIEQKGRNLDGVVVGKVLICAAHPKSDRLHLLTVDIGAGKPLHIVCGAPNARAGIFVAVATVGTKLPNGLEIKESEIRGEKSCGMCCSYEELDYSGEGAGIIELPQTAKIGAKITEAMPDIIDDILDIDNKSITNRPDLWGHYGIARELSVLFNRKFKEAKTDIIAKYKDLPALDIKIENDNCLSYRAVKIENIGGVKSPELIQNRLWYCGHNSHGFLVDVTNYVMLIYGNPIHAFDARTVGKISVGGIKPGTKFTTLKDNEITATKDMLFIKSGSEIQRRAAVIKSEANLSAQSGGEQAVLAGIISHPASRGGEDNALRAVALAGVMGGKDSEIKADTTDTVFEVATFNAGNVRRTSAAAGLRTDASSRYEKALDPQTNFLALAEILRLTNKYAKGAKVVSRVTSAVTGNNAVAKTQAITVKKDWLERFTGVKFDYRAVEKHLRGLGFAPEITAAEIKVTVPSYRNWKDITTPADVAEEIVRNYGYQNIVPAAPAVAVKPVLRGRSELFDDEIKDKLSVKYGYSEVHTNIWYNTGHCRALNADPVSHLSVVNSFVKDDNKIRSELLTAMLSAALVNKTANEIRVFEIGRVITGLDRNGNGTEEKHLSGIVCVKGAAVADIYREAADILRDINGRFTFKIGHAADAKFHPKNNAGIYLYDKKIGEVGIINPRVNRDTVGFEVNLSALDFDKFPHAAAPKISKFPKTELDFTFVWDGIYAELDAKLNSFKNEFLLSRRLSAIYENHYTMTFTVGSFEKTLTGAEIGAIHSAVMDFAEQNALKIVK
jgi:phenylalanyl-tRNA synthetase beta chain